MDATKKEEIEATEQADNVEEVEGTGDIQDIDDKDTEGKEEEGETAPAELEAWEITGGEEETGKPEKSLKAKKKWKRKIAAKDEEIEKAKAEIAALKARGNNQQSTVTARPNPLDFETDEEFEVAREKYLINLLRNEEQAEANVRRNQKIIDRRMAGVAEHNVRVGDFVEGKNIDPDVYSNAESVFIGAFEEAFPGVGEAYADDFLSKLGKGSEKIPFFLGRNKAKLAEFREILKEDTSGIKAAIFLGDQNRKLRGTNTGKPKSKAPKPAATATGDTSVNAGSKSGQALRKKYNDLHAKGKGGDAWNVKKEAKAAGIDTSEWAKT